MTPVSSMGLDVLGTVSVAGVVGATVAGLVGEVARVGGVVGGCFCMVQPQPVSRVRVRLRF